MIRLSIQIATLGRPSLLRMLDSVLPQCDPERDEVLIVGPLTALAAVIGDRWMLWPTGLVKVLPCVPRGDWGHGERNLTMRVATGTHLVFGDDDDAFLPGALERIRSAVTDWPGPVMFQMLNPTGGRIWSEPVVCIGNHGTPQFVVPNDPARLGAFGSRYGGDFDFVQSTLSKYPEGDAAVKWVPELIYGCRAFGDVTVAA